jgi:hypothetical protein
MNNGGIKYQNKTGKDTDKSHRRVADVTAKPCLIKNNGYYPS